MQARSHANAVVKILNALSLDFVNIELQRLRIRLQLKAYRDLLRVNGKRALRSRFSQKAQTASKGRMWP